MHGQQNIKIVMIVHGDMTCTVGIMTNDTELRQEAQLSGATPQNQITLPHKKYRLNVSHLQSVLRMPRTARTRRKKCVGFERQMTNQTERRL